MLSEKIYSLTFCPPNICDPHVCPPIFMTSLRRWLSDGRQTGRQEVRQSDRQTNMQNFRDRDRWTSKQMDGRKMGRVIGIERSFLVSFIHLLHMSLSLCFSLPLLLSLSVSLYLSFSLVHSSSLYKRLLFVCFHLSGCCS